MAGRAGNNRTYLVIALLILCVLLASTGEGGMSIAVTIFAGLVVVWMAFSVMFGRRRR
jgi:hypothetical protein